ncbi:MAG: hypothetical protein RR454_05830 [Clostridia bacterium]
MKKTLVTLALVLIVVSSLVSGTLAMYSTSADNFANGSVEAKEFTVVTAAEDSFKQNIQIAPGEKTSMTFTVKNFDGAIITETAMDLAIKVTLKAADGKTAIAPLKISVTKAGTAIGTLKDNVVEITDKFDLKTEGQTYTYTVVIEWPNGDSAIDNQFIGSKFGSAVSVSLVGTQVIA